MHCMMATAIFKKKVLGWINEFFAGKKLNHPYVILNSTMLWDNSTVQKTSEH